MSQDFHQRHQSSFFFPPQSDEGFETPGGVHHQQHLVGGLDHPQETPYETAGMLSEMFDFSTRPSSVTVAATPNPDLVITGDSAAAAMQLFLTDPQSRSPPPPHQFPTHASGFHSQPHYTWIPEGSGAGAIEGQGLSLSLASSLEATHHEMMFFNGRASSSNPLQMQQQFGFGTASSNSVFSLAAVNVLRNSKYTRPAQEILEEFCSVGRGHIKKSINTSKLAGAGGNNINPTASTSSSGGAVKEVPVPVPVPPMSPADRMEHQRRKVKLASMLDEVERRYSHYCEQMQMVVNSFDMVMGFGAAVPYTALAQKAMSRHFRCLKDAIQAQLKQSCEMLGEKESAGGNGITKGETPRLKVLEQSLRKQRAFHQMGMMEQEAWRPQRGLPERSVNVLRAWLFEHFLNPYPSDADKHLLARQTGLSRNQVANWFINARVRLWKPMIEDMYQQESKAHEEQAGLQNDDVQQASDHIDHHHHQHHHQVAANRESESNTSAQTPTLTDPNRPQQPPPLSSAAVVGPTNANAQGFIQTASSYSHVVVDACNNRFIGTTAAATGGGGVDSCHHHDSSDLEDGPTMIRFGTTSATNAGDVSLTLGLRHAGNHPQEKGGGFSFRDFGRAS